MKIERALARYRLWQTMLAVAAVLVWALLHWAWVDFDCTMRVSYAQDHGRTYSKPLCLEARRAEGHWY